jgi:translation initiation factor 2 subunit 1
MSDLPKSGELVICRVTKINPHSAYAIIEEYNREGMIHISEVASGWVKDISKELREGETIVAKVLAVNESIINLSIKRVDDNQKRNKLREYKKEKKAEKLLEMAAKKMKQTSRLQEIKKVIKDKLGTLDAVFEISIKKPELLSEVLNEKWIEAIREIAENNIHEKEYEFKAKIRLVSYEPDGIKKITEILHQGEKNGFDIIYLSAPEYMIKFTSNDAKKGSHEFDKKLEEMAETAKKTGFFKEIKILK